MKKKDLKRQVEMDSWLIDSLERASKQAYGKIKNAEEANKRLLAELAVSQETIAELGGLIGEVRIEDRKRRRKTEVLSFAVAKVVKAFSDQVHWGEMRTQGEPVHWENLKAAMQQLYAASK